MNLPRMQYASGLRKLTQVEFKGYNHTISAENGEIYDMTNMSSNLAPLLSPRPPRRLLTTLAKPNGIYAKDGLVWVDGTDFYYDGEKRGDVTDSMKIFADIGAYIVIFPDKAYYNILKDEFGALESSVTSGTYQVTFTNGTLFGEDAEANTIYSGQINFNEYFTAGDAVTISGCTIHTENNKTPVIREISADGHYMYFYEYNFKLNGDEGITPYVEPGAITFARTVPDLDFICGNDNRLWGCRGDEIFTSMLGNPFNWNVFEGIASDSYNVIVGTAGDFTGCISYLGYPIFFKDSQIYKVFGDKPSNYEVTASASTGVQDGSSASLAVAGEICFYLSRNGIVSYTGGIPQQRYAPFGGELYADGVAGSDQRKYYISMRDDNNISHLFVFDTERSLWHREDNTEALGFAFERNLYMLCANGEIWITGNIIDAPAESAAESPVAWLCEFGDFSEDIPEKKGVTKFYIRLTLEQDAECTVWIRYDSTGEWQEINHYNTTVKRGYTLAVVPHRADHYRLKLTGVGGCVIHGITREAYAGSTNKSLGGRQ